MAHERMTMPVWVVEKQNFHCDIVSMPLLCNQTFYIIILFGNVFDSVLSSFALMQKVIFKTILSIIIAVNGVTWNAQLYYVFRN